MVRERVVPLIEIEILLALTGNLCAFLHFPTRCYSFLQLAGVVFRLSRGFHEVLLNTLFYLVSCSKII